MGACRSNIKLDSYKKKYKLKLLLSSAESFGGWNNGRRMLTTPNLEYGLMLAAGIRNAFSRAAGVPRLVGIIPDCSTAYDPLVGLRLFNSFVLTVY